VDDTVEVGADLYEIDTAAEATVVSADDISVAPSSETTESPEPVMSTSKDEPSSHRVPSIHFLGKDGWAIRKSGKDASEPPPAPISPTGVTVVDGSMLDSMYGRPAFTGEEMEAMVLGGGSLAPEVVVHSHGAQFVK